MPEPSDAPREDQNAKIRVDHLTKIFGPDPESVLGKLEGGESGTGKDEMLEETGHVLAVSDVSFSVKPGQTFVVMGLSGSGKSTLVRCINRLIEPTRGHIVIEGEDIVEADEDKLREIRLNKMAMVFQHFALFPHRTVAENAAFGLKIRGVRPEERRERALKALEQVGLKHWADNSPGTLSGGMKQRVGLARALAVDPEILLMDEPFSALDPLIRRDMQGELIELQRKLHKTIIFITHDLHEALILGDRIAIMKEGRFVQVGAPENIVAEPADDYVAAFTQDVDRGRVITVGSVMRSPTPLKAKTDTLASARERLETDAARALHVVDDDGRVVGLIRREDVDGADAEEKLDKVMRTDFATAEPDAHLSAVFEECARGLPIAVLDDEGRLSGRLEPLDVFNALSIPEEDAAEKEAKEAAQAPEPPPAAAEQRERAEA